MLLYFANNLKWLSLSKCNVVLHRKLLMNPLANTNYVDIQNFEKKHVKSKEYLTPAEPGR